ncbi:hypothetical protein X975_20332, partial [Stegodyphus mimosarum]
MNFAGSQILKFLLVLRKILFPVQKSGKKFMNLKSHII